MNKNTPAEMQMTLNGNITPLLILGVWGGSRRAVTLLGRRRHGYQSRAPSTMWPRAGSRGEWANLNDI